MTLVRHRAIDRVRTEATRPQLAGAHREPGEEHSRSAQDHAVTRDENETLRALVRKLPREQIEVIALAFFGELTHSEIASELNLPLGTVKGRVRLGLERLRIETETRNIPSAERDGGPTTLPSSRRRFRRRSKAPEALRRDSRP